MSEHLPECEPDLQLPDGSFIACICDRLRACEQRLFVDRTQHWHSAYASGLIEGDSGGRREGYRIGMAYERARILEIIAATRHEDACCSRGCACQTHERPEPCDLLCNCMVGSVVGEVLYALSRINPLDAPVPEPPEPNAQPAFVDRWSGRDAKGKPNHG